MFEVGWEDYVWSDGVCLIEWADLIEELTEELPGDKITEIRIEKNPEKGFDYRKLLIR
jgi:tRNA threonylcarbamoyladenosine biosynthesis protein TsaE